MSYFTKVMHGQVFVFMCGAKKNTSVRKAVRVELRGKRKLCLRYFTCLCLCKIFVVIFIVAKNDVIIKTAIISSCTRNSTKFEQNAVHLISNALWKIFPFLQRAFNCTEGMKHFFYLLLFKNYFFRQKQNLLFCFIIFGP